MRECINCRIVKFDFNMFKIEHCNFGGCYKETLWLCKECAKTTGKEKVEEVYRKIKDKFDI